VITMLSASRPFPLVEEQSRIDKATRIFDLFTQKGKHHAQQP
jgi:hypothetical protein